MKTRWTLKTQLIVTYIFLVGSVLICSLFYTYNNMMQVMLKNVEEMTLSKVDKIESNMMDFQEEMEKILIGIFLNTNVLDFFENDYGMDIEGVTIRKTIGDYLDQLIVLNPCIESIFISKNDGSTIGTEKYYTYNYEATGEDRLNINSFGMNMPKWEGRKTPISYKPKESFVISASQQFIGKKNQTQLGISINIKEEYFRELYNEYGQDNLPEVYICDQEGVIISSSNPDHIGKKAEVFDQLSEEKENGSFVYLDQHEEKQQIIFYNLPRLQWKVIEQVPLAYYTKDTDFIKMNLIVVSLISIIASIILAIIFIKKITVPINVLSQGMKKVKEGKIGYQIKEKYHNEFRAMTECFNEMSSSMENLIEENQQIEQQKMNYALSALRAQINPHFIFNTLNMVKWMAIAQEANNIKDAMELLMKFLRPVFKERNTYCTLQEELEYLENYIKLINLRFGETITLNVSIPSEYQEKQIPRFILQPIIENCMQHGFREMLGREQITIRAQEEDGFMIYIEDNGVGIKAEDLEKLQKKLHEIEYSEKFFGESIGLINVNLRIKLNYGLNYGVEIQSEEHRGTHVMIKLP